MVKCWKHLENLKNSILPLSENQTNFDEARKGWQSEHRSTSQEFKDCAYGYNRVKHLFHLKHNGNINFVGEVYFYKYIEIFFNDVHGDRLRMSASRYVKSGSALIEYAYRHANENDFFS